MLIFVRFRANHVTNGIEYPILHRQITSLGKFLEKLKNIANVVRFEIVAV